MSKKTVLTIAILILSPIIIYFLWPSDESRIRKLFREGAKAIEQEKIDDVMSRVSFNYTDDNGLSYIAIKEGMGRVFQQMSGIKVEYKIKNITIKNTSATADLDMRVIASYGQDTGYTVGDAANPAHMKFYLEKERTKWLVSKTEGIPLEF
jgi:hypothetical protein